MPSPSLEAVGLSHYYGQFAALSELNLRLEGQKCVGFLGPNGAGKTTILPPTVLFPLQILTKGPSALIQICLDTFPDLTKMLMLGLSPPRRNVMYFDRNYAEKAIACAPLLPPPGDEVVKHFAQDWLSLHDQWALLDAELSRLGHFILEKFPEEPGATGKSESAVDVAIRLLERYEEKL